MTFELQRFHAAFFAESRDGLDVMETGLLQMERGQHDAEVIHSIFRAAHSIKGGAGTFGFGSICDLTHVLETLLDEVRSGQRQANSELLDAMLAAVDGVRALLREAEHGTPADSGAIKSIGQRLSALLETVPTSVQAIPAAQFSEHGWAIRFIPETSMFQRGNDPLRMVRELHALGELQVTPLFARMPGFAGLEPLSAYLGWEFQLQGEVSRQEIEEVFAWVDGECELEIVARNPSGAAQAAFGMSAVPVQNHAESAEQSIRVSVDRIDALINLLGELVITQAMLKQIGSDNENFSHERLRDGLELLERNTRNLQQAVIHVRMLPIDSVFMRFPRLVRDLSHKLGKQVKLCMLGEGTELDRGLIEKITDPLVHLVRNAIDHGLETPDARLAGGKDASGTITLAAAQQGGYIIIEVSDDGCGLDRDKIIAKAIERGIAIPDAPGDAQILELVFAPGFSTANSVTEVSGRGVGMDVVRRNIQALNGEVQLDSTPGQGTRVVIRLPLSLAIVDGMIVGSSGQVLVLPLSNVIEALQLDSENIRTLTDAGHLLRVRDEYLPILRLGDSAASDGDSNQLKHAPLAVVVEGGGYKVALEVDELICQQQVVVKNIESNYRHIDGISGATILGDGQVALIVDVGDLVRTRHGGQMHAGAVN